MKLRRFVLGLVFIVAGVVQADTIRVPGQYPTIQAGIDAAQDGDTVLVADGVYTGDGNRDIDYGGKLIDVVSENGPDNCTIDCQSLGRAFIFQNGETDQSIVEGFTITNGRAPAHQLGGGIVFLNSSSATITGCVITRCATGIYNGGAVFCGPGSKTIITGCTFTENSSGGGVVFCDRSEGTISHCVFTNNTCGIGGGIFCSNASPNIFNCLIFGNTATDWPGGGGIMLNAGANPNIFDCTITDNEADDGGAVYCHKGSSPNIRDSILWGNSPDEIYVESGNPVVTYSDVQGGWPGEGNIDKKPRFVSGPLGDFYLSQKRAGQDKNSRCVNKGDGKAKELGLKKYTTRTDGKKDRRAVDMGYHYPR